MVLQTMAVLGTLTDMNATVGRGGGMVLSVSYVLRCYKQGKLGAGVSQLMSELKNWWDTVMMSCSCEKLVAEARDSSGTQGKGNILCSSRYQAMDNED
jgi:hypothetical protein